MKRGFKIHTIRGKLFAGVLLTTIASFVVVGATMIFYDLRDYHRRAVQDLTTQADLVRLAAAPALQFNDLKLATSTLALLKARPLIESAAIYGANGALEATYQRSPLVSHSSFPVSPQPEGHSVSGDSIFVFKRIVDHGTTLGTLYIRADYQIKERTWRHLGMLLVVMVMAIIAAMLASLWLQNNVAKPITDITTVAQNVTERRDYALRVHKKNDDEVGYLVDAFNELLAVIGERSAALERSNAQIRQQMSETEAASAEIQRLNEELEIRVAVRTSELERANKELEAFSYSVSHDLRTPLRAIDGFSQALLEDYADQMDDTARDYLARVRSGAQRMGQLIDDLLKLSRVSRADINRQEVNLSAVAEEVVSTLKSNDAARTVEIAIEPDLWTEGDQQLLRIALENLIGNAWKYTGKRDLARITFGQSKVDGKASYYVKDNGDGFDMAYANKLFRAFQRLHDDKDFQGTGVGLATVQRIVHRHGGEIWADASPGEGATFHFTLSATSGEDDEHETNTPG